MVTRVTMQDGPQPWRGCTRSRARGTVAFLLTYLSERSTYRNLAKVASVRGLCFEICSTLRTDHMKSIVTFVSQEQQLSGLQVTFLKKRTKQNEQKTEKNS